MEGLPKCFFYILATLCRANSNSQMMATLCYANSNGQMMGLFGLIILALE